MSQISNFKKFLVSGLFWAAALFGGVALPTLTLSQGATGVAATTPGLTPQQQEAEWQAELSATEADIAKWQSILDTTKAGTQSLLQDAAVLNAKIKQAQDSSAPKAARRVPG